MLWPIRRRYLPTTLSVTLLTSFLVGASSFGVPVLLRRAPWMAEIRQMTAQALSNALSLPVAVEQVDIVAGGDLRLRDVSISVENGQAGVRAQAGEITVALSLWQLVRLREVAPAIRQVTVKSLRIEGRGELDELQRLWATQKREKQSSLPFPIVLRNVTVAWADWSAQAKQIALTPAAAGWLTATSGELVPAGPGLPAGIRLSGSIAVGPDTVKLQNVQANTPAGLIRAGGQVNWGAAAGWHVMVTMPAFQPPSAFGPLPPAPVAVSGELKGPIAAPYFTFRAGQGRAEFTGEAEWQAPLLIVSRMQGRLTEGSYTLTGRYNTREQTIAGSATGEKLPAGEALAWAGLSWPVSGRLSGTVRISGKISSPLFQVQVTGEEGEAWRQPFSGLQAGLRYQNGVTTLQSLTAAVAGGTITGQGVVRAGQLDLAFNGKRITSDAALAGAELWFTDPANNRLFANLARLSLQGTWQGDVHVTGSTKRPLITADVVTPAMQIAGKTAGRWQVQLSSGLDWRKTLTFAADIATVQDNTPVTAQVKGTTRDNVLVVTDCKIAAGSGKATATGEYAAGKWRATAEWRDLPAALLGYLAGLPQPLSGNLQGKLQAAGGREGLTGRLDWQSASLTINSSQLANVGGTVLAENGRLQLQQWRGTAAGRNVQLQGVLPLPRVVGGTGTPVDLTLDVPDGPLGPLAAWLPLVPALRDYGAYLKSMEGTGRVQLRLTGRAGAWNIDGQAALAKGRFNLPEPWGRIEQLEMVASFDGTLVRLSKLTGRALGGQWQGSGVVQLKPGTAPAIQADLKGNNLRPALGGLSGEGDVDLQIGGALDDPQITGQMVVRRGDIDLFSLHLPAGEKQAGAAAGSPHLGIDITASRVRIKAGAFLDTYISGALRLGGTRQNPTLNGQLSTERGKINYLGTNFTISSGRADFAPYRDLWPELTLAATAWSGRHVITLQMSGIYPDLQAHLRSEPPLSEQEIIALLAWPERVGKLGEAGSGTFGQNLAAILQGSVQAGLVGEVETSVRDSLGLDDFRLQPDFTEHSLRISAGKYIAPRLYLSYGRTLFDQPRDELRLEYQMDKGWKLSGGLGDDGAVSMGLELKFKF